MTISDYTLKAHVLRSRMDFGRILHTSKTIIFQFPLRYYYKDTHIKSEGDKLYFISSPKSTKFFQRRAKIYFIFLLRLDSQNWKGESLKVPG